MIILTPPATQFEVPPPPEKIAGGFQQAGKKEGGLGEGIFARLPVRRRRTMGWESVSAIPLLRGRQSRKIFVSLIEKNFWDARFKKCKENFSVLLVAGAKRRRAEMLGGIQSAKSSGFCSKKVRISSNKHHTLKAGRKVGFDFKGKTITLYILACSIQIQHLYDTTADALPKVNNGEYFNIVCQYLLSTGRKNRIFRPAPPKLPIFKIFDII